MTISAIRRASGHSTPFVIDLWVSVHNPTFEFHVFTAAASPALLFVGHAIGSTFAPTLFHVSTAVSAVPALITEDQVCAFNLASTLTAVFLNRSSSAPWLVFSDFRIAAHQQFEPVVYIVSALKPVLNTGYRFDFGALGTCVGSQYATVDSWNVGRAMPSLWQCRWSGQEWWVRARKLTCAYTWDQVCAREMDLAARSQVRHRRASSSAAFRLVV